MNTQTKHYPEADANGWIALSKRKPTPDDRVRELVKAGALVAAEIDRLNRAAAMQKGVRG